MATIEFRLDGTVVDANPNFLALMGYTREQIVGQHHRLFVDPAEAATPEYALFWDRLRAGELQRAQFRRITRAGQDVWLEASYTPLFDEAGKPSGVIKIATDITAAKRRDLDTAGQLAAVSKAMAVIEFGLDGTILQANDNFLSVLGYEAREVVGHHHRMFVDAEYAASADYAQFWSELRAGKEQQAEFVRYGKGGRRVVIQAVYSPIFDVSGKPFKVVKYATDMTEQRAKDDESRQIRNALDSSRTNMMVANERFEITYVNESMHRLLTEAEAEIRKALPHFRADALLGLSIDSFHAHPEHTRQRLMGLNGHHGVRITLGTKVFDLGISAARHGGKVVGFAVEWIDVTERLHEENVVQKEVARVVAAAVEGDLRDRIDLSAFRPGFLRDVSERINTMLDSLNDALSAVKNTTAEIGQAATQFRATSRLMAGSAEQLTAAVATSSSTLAQVSQAVGDNAERATAAYAVVRTMAAAASEGSARMRELREAMDSISSSSEQVISIIKVIDEIAFQTNLLALNAAIEAARAGRHGKGFAVVAQEVRSLAVRSAGAARESAGLIQGAVARVGEGVTVAQLTEGALSGIAKNVEQVVTFVSGIAASSQQQSRSLVDVNAAVAQVSIGAQAGSQQSIEVAVASEQLARQTEVLLQRTDRYSVNAPSAPVVDAPSPELLAEIAELVRQHTPLRRAS